MRNEQWRRQIRSHSANLTTPLPGLADLLDEGVGLAIEIRQQNGVAGLTFDHGGQVGLAVLTPENQQIRFPVTEGLAIFNLGRPMLDRAVGWHEGSARFAPYRACRRRRDLGK